MVTLDSKGYSVPSFFLLLTELERESFFHLPVLSLLELLDCQGEVSKSTSVIPSDQKTNSPTNSNLGNIWNRKSILRYEIGRAKSTSRSSRLFEQRSKALIDLRLRPRNDLFVAGTGIGKNSVGTALLTAEPVF